MFLNCQLRQQISIPWGAMGDYNEREITHERSQGRYGISNHQQCDCKFSKLLRLTINNKWTLRFTICSPLSSVWEIHWWQMDPLTKDPEKCGKCAHGTWRHHECCCIGLTRNWPTSWYCQQLFLIDQGLMTLFDVCGHGFLWFNSLAPGIFEMNFVQVIFKINLAIYGRSISSEIVLRWMSMDLTDDKSTLVQVMAWCHQATSHYLSHCWPRSMSPYGVPRPQWVK